MVDVARPWKVQASADSYAPRMKGTLQSNKPQKTSRNKQEPSKRHHSSYFSYCYLVITIIVTMLPILPLLVITCSSASLRRNRSRG